MTSDIIPPSLSASRLRWDVFLSFRGGDTRHVFTKDLRDSLVNEGIRTFLDDDGLKRGEEIATSLLEAIEDSAASIIIVSPNYCDSRWCLDELAKICELRRLIIPVFYGVVPSDVRRQTGPFEKDFKAHEQTFTGERVTKWRNAMAKVGSIDGYFYSCPGFLKLIGDVNDDKVDQPILSRDKQELIRLLVKRVLTELSNTPVNVAAYKVGLDSRIKYVMNLLDIKSNRARVLGLHGLGGVGKTTLAKALFDKLVDHFEHHSFISDISNISGKDGGLISLQSKLLGDLGGVLPIKDVNDGLTKIINLVHEKKVLMVLDNIDNVSQLDALAGKREWFGEGSRILITTRDVEVLREHFVDKYYEVRELDESLALELFSYHAFRREKPTKDFLNLSKQIVSHTGCLPLALEVFGSYLLDKRSMLEWEGAFEKLGHNFPVHLQAVLMISYNVLDVQEKCMFLDIACLFGEMRIKRDDAIDMFRGCGFQAETAIRVLTAKSLIKITEDDTLWMHDQLRDMGRQIVQLENMYPGSRSRLWNRKEIMDVLKDQQESNVNQGIVVDYSGKAKPRAGVIPWNNLISPTFAVGCFSFIDSTIRCWKEMYYKMIKREMEDVSEGTLQIESFRSMVCLRLLQINHVKLVGNFKVLPGQLKWLQWKGCPLKSIPSDFCPSQLAVLDLSESKIERLGGSLCNKVAENLMVINLQGCYNLVEVPDISGQRNLEKLILQNCRSLVKIHKSVGFGRKLRHLNLRDCTNLSDFPTDVSGLNNLENLILSGCSKLKKLPDDLGKMRSLKELLVDETAIEKLPESILHLEKLAKLSLNHCKSLKRLPDCIGKLFSLKQLSLNGSALEALPDSVGSLTNLDELSLAWCKFISAIPDAVGNLKSLAKIFANHSGIQKLPESIGTLSYLKVLDVGNCKLMSNLPVSLGGLASLVELQLSGTPFSELPTQIGDLKSIRKLEMISCKVLISLPENIGCMTTLTYLNLHGSNVSELPESIGDLENLVILRLNRCNSLYKLPDSIGRLKSLCKLFMEETSVTELPESFGMLSNLMTLKMFKKPLFRISGPSSVISTSESGPDQECKFVELPKSFSNLSSLEEIDARSWRISGIIPDDFEKLSSLEYLNLGNNYISSLPSSLMGLSVLKKLLLSDCRELKSLPQLPSSLEELNVANCISLEHISDLSKLQWLEQLNLTNCEKVVDIPGLECLNALKRLYMSGCNACSSVVKRRLSKNYLRKLRNLSMPGSRIPDWFSKEVITVPFCQNREICEVILGVVVSLNHETPDDLREQLPAVVDIQAKIVRLDGREIYNHTLILNGVPRTDDDQVHLCRYPVFHPLVSMLEQGYMIQVAKRNPPAVSGVELKKSGVYLVFDGDDDYGGNEESLDQTQQSVSEKLAQFFSSFDDDDEVSNFNSGGGHQQTMETRSATMERLEETEDN